MTETAVAARSGRRFGSVGWPALAVVVALAVLLAVVFTAGLGPWDLTARARWAVILATLTGFVVVLGRALTGTWYGIVLSSRNLVSLSRFQALLWSLLVLSMTLALSLARMRDGDGLITEVPPETLALLGGAGTSAVFANGILSGKARRLLSPAERDAAARDAFTRQESAYLAANGGDPAAAWEEARRECEYVLYHNSRPAEARLRDMFEGDQTGGSHTVDFAKVQLFLFTLVVAITFVAAFWTGSSQTVPTVPLTLVGALGVSQAGYVTSKAPEQRPRV